MKLKLVEELALAKLNLTLGILYKREDGYHAIDTVMQTVSLFDRVIVEPARTVEVTVTGMTLPPDNTMVRAAELYRQETGCGARIRCARRACSHRRRRVAASKSRPPLTLPPSRSKG